MDLPDPITLYDRLMAVKPPGLSRHAWSTRAGLSRNVFNDIRKRDAAHHTTIEKLLDAIGVTFAEFEAGARQPEREPPPAAVRAPYMAFRGQDRPRDVPIVGTALCADLHLEEEGEIFDVEAMEMDFDEVVDYARRPLTLDNRRDVYAIYFRGVSLEPRYEAGEIAYVDPKRPPARGEYAVLQLRKSDEHAGERIAMVIAKRLVRQTARYYELEQFNPEMTFRLARERIARIHRIIPWGELVSF